MAPYIPPWMITGHSAARLMVHCCSIRDILAKIVPEVSLVNLFFDLSKLRNTVPLFTYWGENPVPAKTYNVAKSWLLDAGTGM